MKIRGMTEKSLLREAARAVLTDAVYARQKLLSAVGSVEGVDTREGVNSHRHDPIRIVMRSIA